MTFPPLLILKLQQLQHLHSYLQLTSSFLKLLPCCVSERRLTPNTQKRAGANETHIDTSRNEDTHSAAAGEHFQVQSNTRISRRYLTVSRGSAVTSPNTQGSRCQGSSAPFFFLLLPYFSVFSKETEGRRPKQRRPLMMSCCADSNSFVQLTNKSSVKPQQKLHPQEPTLNTFNKAAVVFASAPIKWTAGRRVQISRQ